MSMTGIKYKMTTSQKKFLNSEIKVKDHRLDLR